jgi:hypothetical protein
VAGAVSGQTHTGLSPGILIFLQKEPYENWKRHRRDHELQSGQRPR